MSKVAVLGVGAMGSRMAINFARAGHEVTVWNRNPGAAVDLAAAHQLATAASPSLAAAGADVVLSMLSDDEASTAVWLGEHGALDSMRPGTLAIESSTLTPGAVRRLAVSADAAGVQFVEAPVVGSRPQAEAGALFYLLAGEAEAVDASMPYIEVSAGNSTRLGEAGDAALLKLAINGLFAAQVAAYAEMAGFIERSTLDTEAAMATLAALPITSPGLQRIVGLIGARDYSPNFPIRLVAKDLGYLGRASEELGASLPVSKAAEGVFTTGAETLGDLDIAGIARRFEA